jgi:hypothetical protein
VAGTPSRWQIRVVWRKGPSSPIQVLTCSTTAQNKSLLIRKYFRVNDEQLRAALGRLQEFAYILLAELELMLVQSPPKQLVPKPKPIRVDHIGLAVVRNLLNTARVEAGLYLAAIDTIGLTGPMIRTCRMGGMATSSASNLTTEPH